MSREKRITSMSENGPPPRAAAVLYPGEVIHQRLNPFGHRFSYRVFSLLLDLDRLCEIDRISRLLSVNRAGLVAFHDKDHAELGNETAREYTDRLLAGAGLPRRAARVLLLAYPRILGYVFNPIAVYFAYDELDRLVALIYGVRNTFGERHSYVALVEPGDLSEAGIRQSRRKRFHVSPFIGMEARYHFRILPPGRSVRLRIHETEAGAPLLAATFSGNARSLTTTNLIACLLQFPFMTWKIIVGIHWEALKLWAKGARFISGPPAPETASFRDHGSLEPGE